ncbi:DUF2312 domain-containing protein [Novosphingopyxis sp. YJ-S2-01]|nr:DUF2312 domain-containing protein [Novosphingopyxis sp. YJ-S2-01]
MSGPGHNSGDRAQAVEDDSAEENATTTDQQLRLFIERVELLEEEKKGTGDDIRDVYSEAKSQGYDVKIMRQIVRLRKLKPEERKEMELLIETYKAALGIG